MKKHYLKKSSPMFVAAFILLQSCSTQEPVESSIVENETRIEKHVSSTSNQKPINTSKGMHHTDTAESDALPSPYISSSLEKKETLSTLQTPRVAKSKAFPAATQSTIIPERVPPVQYDFDRESYNAITENSFVATANDPLSTFSIDVDTASYANIRRFIQGSTMPPVGAVRIEEMINYFNYDYPAPGKNPIGISAEVGPCPWEAQNKLVRIGVNAKELTTENLPPSNLVFLIDVSGSMNQKNKLPLLKQSMLLLTEQLTSKDRVSIVVYAGSDRVVLPPTGGDKQDILRNAINNLQSGGSTHASSGITTAYKLAESVFMPGGNNRIILASDGDFNVGVTSRGELERLITEKRDSGVFLSVLGFGMGNYHDDSMELLADKGNGNYSYIDNLLEAKKVLVKERASTLFTLARDVKIQVEFNPAKVGGYRLIGYENRLLNDEDFNDDTKDAGEIGAGHTVTALYELLPPAADSIPDVDQLKYQKAVVTDSFDGELMNIKLRYKEEGNKHTSLLSTPVADSETTFEKTSDDFRFSSSVAAFGMLLRDSKQNAEMSYSNVISTARKSRGEDPEGYRAEFIRIVEMAELLDLRS